MEGIRMVTELPKIREDNKTYYFDERLRQLRNVNNPHDFVNINDFEMQYYKEKVEKNKKSAKPRLSGKTVTEEDKGKYDWSKKVLMGVSKKWVYYRLPKKGSDKMESIKLYYDRMQDWEFEHEKE
jgi:hypothetical protein